MRTCPKCNGKGKVTFEGLIGESVCFLCDATGMVAAPEALSNNNGSGVSEASMPSPDLGEGKEK